MKVIKPLFLDELWEEFERVKGNSKQLQYFHEKLSKLTYLDPACGCGNFLIIAYKELRLLELEVLKMLIDTGGQMVIDITGYCKVNVDQFYGIEIEEFPCQIAVVGMWLIDHQMNTLVSEHFGLYFARLPLEKSATIVNGNALRIDWNNVIPENQLTYILGNPPFLGYSMQTKEQKADLLSVLIDETGKTIKKAGKIDFVAGWYFKAAEYIQGTSIRVAFVSTNSIIQGEQVSTVWKPLMKMYSIVINFAYRPFIWSNEAKGKAAVHCVIVGFSKYISGPINLFTNNATETCKNISPYLVNAPTVFIESRTKPICNVPKMTTGSRPTDGGHLILKADEVNDFIKNDPHAEIYIRPFIGADEFINNRKRYILYLKNCNPSILRKMPLVKERLKKVAEYRLRSTKESTRFKAGTPAALDEDRVLDKEYLLVPSVSSENRKYIPIGFIKPHIISSNAVLVIPDAKIYHFGVLTSHIHMSWTNAVAGRLESRYRYSKDIVYNNFPWPDPTETQTEAIEKAAQQVLDVRKLFPDSSLADLYDPLTMPPELTEAHNNLDRAVVAAYDGPGFKTEAERVADLMKRYQVLTTGKS